MRRGLKLTFALVAFIATAATIWYFSGKNGVDSHGISRSMADRIADVLSHFFSTALHDGVLRGKLNFGLRKAAHVLEYMLFGATLLTFFEVLFGRILTACAPTLLFSAVWSAADEFRQTFISGRSGKWTDMTYDLAGVMLGIAVAAVLIRLMHVHGWKRDGRSVGATGAEADAGT